MANQVEQKSGYISPELALVEKLLLSYAQLYAERYRARWIPDDECIQICLGLLKSRLPGFAPYTIGDLQTRLNEFFRCREDWLVSCKHNFKVFVKHLHRWVPSRTSRPSIPRPEPGPSTVESCLDHPDQTLKRGDLCLLCFPLCNKCQAQHSVRETCNEYQERADRIKAMLANDGPRGKKVVSIGGGVVVAEKQVKEIREAQG